MHVESHVPVAELESAIFAAGVGAGSARETAEEVIHALAPALGDLPAALAARDADGITLHVLAETEPRPWPAVLQPRFAVRGESGIDAASSALVIPLRADGRVVGALLLGDADAATAQRWEGDFSSVLEASAVVMHSVLARAIAETRRQAVARRSVESIVDGMAHQISNPLTGASAIAQLLSEEMADEGQRAAIRQIQQEIKRAFGVIHDLLDFQRDTHVRDGVLDLSSIVERVVRFRGYSIREMGITLSLETADRMLPVRADLVSLEHAILVALRFAEMQSQGTLDRRIAVRVIEYGAREVAVEITDSGPGVEPDLTPRLYDLPLVPGDFSVGDAERATPDMGLVASTLRAAGGRVEVNVSGTAGTAVSLILPRARVSLSGSDAR